MLIHLLSLLLIAQIWGAPNDYSIDDGMHPNFFSFEMKQFRKNSAENSKFYWIENGQKTVYEKIARPINQNIAKNVILFLGDGMSIPTVSAARAYSGGEENHLSFDEFPYTALSKTYAVDKQVADSANTATAYLCGVKANYGTIGVGPEVLRSDCKAQPNTTNHVLSIAYYSQLQKKRTGLVTTARVTHASPGGVYAHTADRNWESDADVLSSGQDPEVCTDIATQLVYGKTGSKLNVIMGGGRSKFLPKNVKDNEGLLGSREDRVNLIEEWLSSKNGKNSKTQYVWNRTELLDLDEKVDNLLGLFASDHMDYNLDRNPDQQPSLAEMTTAAIKILSKGPKGYFLFVEGAKIDMAHHLTQAKVALDETLEFSKAIQAAVDLTSEEDTLIVVTSDHAHTMSYSGYADRGNDILSFGGKGSDKIPYTTLNYANGPGYRPTNNDGSRYDVSKDDYTERSYTFPAVAPLSSETHGGDDVGVFARGPWAHLFSGVIEENVIPHLMSYASCVGEGFTACDKLLYKCK